MSLRMQWTIGGQDVAVEFDASITERYESQAQVTEHQVEVGANITDHVRPMPLRISVEVFVTETPILAQVLLPSDVPDGKQLRVPDTNASTLQFESRMFRVQGVYEALEDARKAAALVEVITSQKTYDNFIIVSLVYPRDGSTGSAAQFTIDLQEIITVDTATVKELAGKPKPKVKKSKGEKPTKEAEPEQKKAVAAALADTDTGKAIGNFLFGGGH